MFLLVVLSQNQSLLCYDLLTSHPEPTQASVHHCVVLHVAVELSLKHAAVLFVFFFVFFSSHVITKKL